MLSGACGHSSAAHPSSLRTPSPRCACGGRGTGLPHSVSPLQLRTPAPTVQPLPPAPAGRQPGRLHTSALRSQHLPAPSSHWTPRAGLSGRVQCGVGKRTSSCGNAALPKSCETAPRSHPPSCGVPWEPCGPPGTARTAVSPQPVQQARPCAPAFPLKSLCAGTRPGHQTILGAGSPRSRSP